MTKVIEEEVEEFAKQVYVFKTNVPLKYAEELRDWNINCKLTAPEGFEDFRWGKMMYDHYFVKNFRPLLNDLSEHIKDLEDKIDLLIFKLSEKTLSDENKDLFK